MKSNLSKRPYWLWDYDLTESQVREILGGKNETEKIWLMSRILESARYDDIWSYFSLTKLKESFSKLHLKPPIRRAWEQALYVWT